MSAATAVRQSTARPGGCSSSCSGQRVANRSAASAERRTRRRPGPRPAAPWSVSGTGRRPGGQPALAPARASSTSVACDTPVAPRGAYGSGLAVVGGPGDIEVDPRLGDELADEQAALDQRTLGRPGVLEIAVPAVHLGHVVVDERQLPVALAGPVAGRHDLVVERLRRPERPGHEVAERPRHGAGQRRHVDEVGRAEPLGVGQRVAQDEAALGVGVGDVDLLAVERGDDVAGPGRVRAGHVLDGRGDRQERRAGRQPGDGGDGRDHGAGTGLVHLHLFHPAGRLDADPARIEADALADDGEVPVERVALPFLARAHDDHPRRVVAAATDRHEHAHPELGRPLGLDDVDPQPVLLGDGAGLVGQDRRADVVRGAVRQRAGKVRALGDDDPPFGRRGQGRGVLAGGDEDQLVEDRRRRLDRCPGRSCAGRSCPRRRRGRPARRRRPHRRRARRPAA